MRTLILLCSASIWMALTLLWAPPARADGKRDLEDGIAFYENLDTERALERLRSAAAARELGPNERARALLYLGLVQFESGERAAAAESWKRAFALDAAVRVPAGTSPKAVEAIDAARSGKVPALSEEPGRARPGGATDRSTPTSDSTRDSTRAEKRPSEATGAAGAAARPGPAEEGAQSEADAAKLGLTGAAPGPAPGDADTGVRTWLLVGGIGAAAIGAVVVTVLLLGGSSGGDCREGGGCLSVTFQ